jgi:hypothetical protein
MGEGDMNTRALLAAALIGTPVQAGDIDPEVPAGWHEMVGSGPMYGAGKVQLPKICETGVDRTLADSGQGNLTVYCPNPAPGAGGMIQRFPADDFRGKRVRFSAFVQTQDIRNIADGGVSPGFNFVSASGDSEEARKGIGGLYLRVGVNTGSALVRDDMTNRPITGTTGWAPYEIVVDVPENAVGIIIGVWMQGQGQIWMSNIKFEEVSTSIPVTKEAYDQGPMNLDLR